MNVPLIAGEPDVTPAKVCLVVIFNHRYEQNIAKLEAIYRPRFNHIKYLVPFYEGADPDVIAVYYSSYHFQGFVVEAWKQLQGQGFTHLVFMADDLLLNSRLHKGNLCQELGLMAHPEAAYLKAPRSITEVTCQWPFLLRTLTATIDKNGVNWERELPSYAEAVEILRRQGLQPQRFGWHTFAKGINLRSLFLLIYYLMMFVHRRKAHPELQLMDAPYPMVESYADFFVVPTTVMGRFSHFCGVFAAMGVFVEVALPTALALSATLIRETDTSWRMLDVQDATQGDAFARACHYDLNEAFARMGDHDAYLHPLKLSQWTVLL